MKHKSTVLFTLIAVTGLFLLSGCTKKEKKPIISETEDIYGIERPEPETHPVEIAEDCSVSSFRYSYNNAFGQCGYSYQIRTEDAIELQYECDEYSNYGTMETTLDEAFLTKLLDLLKENQIGRWNDFHDVDPDVTDGDGFSLSVHLSDDTRISASGTNSFPDGYGSFRTQLTALFDPITIPLIEAQRQSIISQGIEGQLDFIMANFEQQGDSGSDSYEFFITTSDIRDNNLDVRIHSESGDFLPQGSYRYYCPVDVQLIPFAKVQELIEKYDLIQWYDYREDAEDYRNAEWFQVDFGFDDDFTIAAFGTEPPEHYEDFRKEYLTLMADTLMDLEARGLIENTADQ